MTPRYPIYVISKGRWETPLTVKALQKMDCPFYLVVERQEAANYAPLVDPSQLLVLPFSDVGSSVPARNWVWEHSISEGHERHWIMDDNIEQFNRMNHNLQHRVDTPAVFCAMEDFVDRYENIAIAGPEYDHFCKSRYKWLPLRLNTRVYSCLLIMNALPHRWRGKYNEDTDLSLRVLKDGWATMLFIAFVQQKTTTMTMKGGNTDTVYKDKTRRAFAESLAEQHPDVVEVVWRYNRWHHQVNYRPFKKNRLIRKLDLAIPDAVNNYGMVLRSYLPQRRAIPVSGVNNRGG